MGREMYEGERQLICAKHSYLFLLYLTNAASAVRITVAHNLSFCHPILTVRLMHILKLTTGRSCRSCVYIGLFSLRSPLIDYPTRSFVTTSLQFNDSKSFPSAKVTWYRQLFPGSREKQQIDTESDEVDETGEARALHEKIKQLEDEIQHLRGAKAGAPDDKTSLIEPLLEQLSDEDRRKVRVALQQAELDDKEQAEVDAESEALAKEAIGRLGGGYGEEILRELDFEEMESELDLATEQKPHMRRFNTCIRQSAANITDPKTCKELWISYERCKRLIPQFLEIIPARFWDILWSSQAKPSPEGHHGASHLDVLSQDILQSGKALSLDQTFTVLDSLIQGKRWEEAYIQWNALDGHNDLDSKGRSQRASLGVQLYASTGNPQTAQEIAKRTIENGDTDDVRLLMPIIEAWATLGTDQSIENAWALYLELRERLGLTIKIQDFDRIAMYFIHAQRTDVGLAIFKDMMLSQKDLRPSSDQLYKTSLALVRALQSNSTSPSEIIKVSLTALSTLPRQFQNKFFYGSWIKKLIGMGEIEAAGSVVELMYERGIQPDARHLNGIIGAWLRDGSAAHKEKAEQIGWAMIHQRLDLVKTRKKKPGTPGLESARLDARVPKRLQRRVPSATIETFSLLLLYNERRSRWKPVQVLKEYLDLAEIPPNSYFMNHLLYAELRQGHHPLAWNIYQNMKSSIQPDLETFACLWDCEKAHLDKLSMYPTDPFPGPRSIFDELMTWYLTLGERHRKSVCADFSEDLYNQIIRCMCLARDLEGTLVALYSLKQSFSFFPNDETLRMIPMQVARIWTGFNEAKTSRRRRRSRLFEIAGSKSSIANVSQVLDLIAEQRVGMLAEKGIRLEEFNEEQQNEEQLFIMAELLRVALRRLGNDEDDMTAAIASAAREMGVGAITL